MTTEQPTATTRRRPDKFFWWLLALLLLLIVAPIAGWLWWQSRGVEAFVIIRVYRDQEQMLRDKYQRGVNPQEYEIEKQTQAALLKSPPVITEALRQPGISHMSIVRDEPWPWMGERDNPVAWLQRELKVRYAEGSEILELSMRERNDKELIRLLNAVTDAYKREVVDKEKINKTRKLRRIQEALEQAKVELHIALEKVAELEQDNQREQSDMELASLTRQQEQAEERLLEIDLQIAAAATQTDSPQPAAALQSQRDLLQERLEALKAEMLKRLQTESRSPKPSVELFLAEIKVRECKQRIEQLQTQSQQMKLEMESRPQFDVLQEATIEE